MKETSKLWLVLILSGGGAFADPLTAPKEVSSPTWPVSGIYTTADTKDLGQLTGISWLSGTKIRGWIDGYYEGNFNGPSRSTVDANIGSSVVQAQNATIEGRAFDVHDRSFTLSLAEIEIEKVPELGGLGFKFDLAFGDTQQIIQNTIQGHLGAAGPGDIITDIDKVFQHASISYLAPLGRGLRFDFGKFVSHVGSETIESVKNWNYSHGLLFTYAVPFQDAGLHVSYPWTDTFSTDVYVLNGLNSTVSMNRGVTLGPSILWTPKPWLSVAVNYLEGPQQKENTSNLRHLVDAQVTVGPFEGLTMMVAGDWGREQGALLSGGPARWGGVAGYVRYKVVEAFEPSIRVEYYRDLDGFTTGLPQDLVSATLTLNTMVGRIKGSGGVLLLRPELRYDTSTANFFTQATRFRSVRNQTTVGVGAAYMF